MNIIADLTALELFIYVFALLISLSILFAVALFAATRKPASHEASQCPTVHPPVGPVIYLDYLDDETIACECRTCEELGPVIHIDGTGTLARALTDWNHKCSVGAS